MKTKNKTGLLTVALGLGAFTLFAQNPGGDRSFGPGGPGGGGPGGGGPRPMPPLVTALDANQDGKIDAAEIVNALTALLSLDKNKDDQLTADELQPARPEGAPVGAGGPGGPSGRGGGRPAMVPPVMTALDVNKDGTLSAEEIAQAAPALKTLDKNNDGELTRDEFMGMPPRGGGRGPAGGGRGPGAGLGQ